MVDLNLIVVVSLGILAILSICMLIVLVPIAYQLSRTLSAAQTLLDSINNDIHPAVKEITESISDTREVLEKGRKSVKEGITETKILVSSSTYGILKGLRSYLSSYKR